MDPRTAYDELLGRAREEALLEGCAGLLAWDEETYLPRRGADHRATQQALLAGLTHGRAVDPRVGELLAAVEASVLVTDPQSATAVNVRGWRRRYDRRRRVPRTLVEELAHVTTLAQQAWADARRDLNFSNYGPWLQRVLALKRDEAGALGGASAYDALLQEYEPGWTGDAVAALLEQLRPQLVALLHAIVGSGRQADLMLLRRHYPVDAQAALGAAVAARLGFDFRRGRLDVAIHPFCTSLGPDDCRLSTRYDPRDFGLGFFTILHETGHGLYEQGLDTAHYGTPMGEAASVAMHECQSRLWENLVGRHRAFWEHFFPHTRQAFPAALGDVTLDDFHGAVNAVRPSPIRARADEVTYNLHILIRFRLERALLSGELPVKDVPAAWDEDYRQTLGIVPPNAAEGCLQDGHWAGGLVGYFPTYALGNVYAAQLFARAADYLAGLGPAFARGDFSGLLGWLREHIHRHGQRYPAARLVELVTGEPPGPGALMRLLHERYRELYEL
jgi:carboxypeptidase Taq